MPPIEMSDRPRPEEFLLRPTGLLEVGVGSCITACPPRRRAAGWSGRPHRAPAAAWSCSRPDRRAGPLPRGPAPGSRRPSCIPSSDDVFGRGGAAHGVRPFGGNIKHKGGGRGAAERGSSRIPSDIPRMGAGYRRCLHPYGELRATTSVRENFVARKTRTSSPEVSQNTKKQLDHATCAKQ